MRFYMLLCLFLISLQYVSPCVEVESPEDVIDSRSNEQRSSTERPIAKWYDGTVPYVFDESLSENARRSIRSAMNEIEQHTCVRFVEVTDRTYHHDYLSIRHGSGCNSFLGRRGGRQYLTLQDPACMGRGFILHELLHTLGFLHEHARPDRDEYVIVIDDNIMNGKLHNFLKSASYETRLLDLDYDYRSVMHYMANTWANGTPEPTIMPKYCDVQLKDLGHGRKYGYLTKLDIKKINIFYKCSK